MIRKNAELNYRFVMSLITLLCTMGGAATGQNDSGSKPEPEAEQKAAGVVERESTLSTLDELKAAGALLSSYRNLQSRSIGTAPPKADLAAFRKDVEPVLKKAS